MGKMGKNFNVRIIIVIFMCFALITLPISGIAGTTGSSYANTENGPKNWTLEPDPGITIQILITGTGANLYFVFSMYDDDVRIMSITVPATDFGAGNFTGYLSIGGYIVRIPVMGNELGKSGAVGIVEGYPVSCDWEPLAYKPSTCVEDGYVSYQCGLHGIEVRTDIVPSTGHIWGDWVISIAPACESDGEKTHNCIYNGCNASETQDILMLGHDWGDWIVTTAPTCLNDGLETCICANDQTHYETRWIDKLGHNWGDWIVTTAPTCLNDGLETCICINDQAHYETRSISKLEHDWGTWILKRNANCTVPGLEELVCRNDASHSNGTRETPLNPDTHAWGAWVVTTPATNATEGVETCVCKNNSAHIMTRTIPKLTASYTVTFVNWDGTVLNIQQVEYGKSAIAPADPTKPGYTFIGWDKLFNYITSNITVTALYKIYTLPLQPPVVTPVVAPVNPPSKPPPLIVDPPEPEPYVPPVVEPPEVTTQPVVDPVEPPISQAAGEVEIDPLPIVQESPHQTTLDRLAEEGVPILAIGGSKVPLAAFPGMSAWALLNLILAILGAVFVVITIIRARAQKQPFRGHIRLISAVALAVFGIIFFILTEDMNSLMVLLWDQWTIFNAAVFAGVVITTKIALKDNQDREKEFESEAA